MAADEMLRDQAGKDRSDKGQDLFDWLDRTAQHNFFGPIGCRSASVTRAVCLHPIRPWAQ